MGRIELLPLILAPILCMAFHEGGHFLMALAFGHALKFRFKGWTPPRFVWDMPEMESWKQALVAVAGFGLELIMAGLLLNFPVGNYYAAFACFHLALYKFYAGEDSDFKWLKR